MTCCTWLNFTCVIRIRIIDEWDSNSIICHALTFDDNSLSVLAFSQPRTKDPVWSSAVVHASALSGDSLQQLAKAKYIWVFSFLIPLLTWNSTRKHVNCNLKNIMSRYIGQEMPHMSKESRPMICDDGADVCEHGLCINSGIRDEVGPQDSKYTSLTLHVD